MTEKLKQIMNSEIVKLPKEQQEAINSIKWGEVTEEIGKNFSLTNTEIDNLQLETGLALLGLFDFDLYVLNIENEVGLSSDMAKKIAEEILSKVFKPVMESMELSIKHKMKFSSPNWKQTVNFIVSGGDYSNFIEKKEEPNIPPSINVKK